MKQVFFAEPSRDIAPELKRYDVVRYNANEGKFQPTAYKHLLQKDAEEKAHELNVEYNQSPEAL